jgi:hypothetical protein
MARRDDDGYCATLPSGKTHWAEFKLGELVALRGEYFKLDKRPRKIEGCVYHVESDTFHYYITGSMQTHPEILLKKAKRG